MKFYIINVIPDNWYLCRIATIFGIPESDDSHFTPSPGDVAFVRLAHTSPCGCIALWKLIKSAPIPVPRRRGPDKLAPWNDTTYRILQHYLRLVEFDQPVSEGFGPNLRSETLGWQINRLYGSIVRLNRAEMYRYLTLVLEQKEKEIGSELAQSLLLSVTGERCPRCPDHRWVTNMELHNRLYHRFTPLRKREPGAKSNFIRRHKAATKH